MAKVKTVTLVDADDWQGLYIDGKLLRQTHKLYSMDIIELLGNAFDFDYEQLNPDSDWLNRRGSLPDSLSEVELDV